MGDIMTPWGNAPTPTPDEHGDTISSTKGGYDLKDGDGFKETPNSVSGIGLQPAIINVPDGPGPNDTVPVPDLTGRNPGTISGS